ncbi:MAG: hypothetical protein H0U69_06810 [Trueperaceae bacterium]|nr:hypothetical protein [Trueperaceae bacterium]
MPDASGGATPLDRLLDERVERFKLRLTRRWPFYGTLALHARYRLGSDGSSFVHTDGRDVWIAPSALMGLADDELDYVLLHVVLHCALRHVSRRGERDPLRWNIAADVVVSLLLEELAEVRAPATFVTSTPGGVRGTRAELKEASVEQIYERVPIAPGLDENPWVGDLLPREVPGQEGTVGVDGGIRPNYGDSDGDVYWRIAFQHAVTQHEACRDPHDGSGALALVVGQSIERLADEQRNRGQGSIDWRASLWQYLIRTPLDFGGPDRRFVAQGIYLDLLEGERMRLHVAIDTSGSIDQSLLARFLAEVEGIVACHPYVEVDLYWCDHEVHGPYPLTRGEEPPAVVGGGGTDFRPFFERIARGPAGEHGAAIYLTDGHGTFPTFASVETLWLVSPGGCPDRYFPFGHVLRMTS